MSEALTITDDKQLEPFGIYTTASAEPTGMLSRQDFQETQRDELDIYPTDEVFVRALLSAIDLVTSDLAFDNGPIYQSHKKQQLVRYINGRRPSQSDFLLEAGVANKVLQTSRYRINSLGEYDGKMDYDRLLVLQRTLARVGFGLFTKDEFEQPIRLSGDVFMSPPWRKDALKENPFMITLEHFKQHGRCSRKDGYLAKAAFRIVGLGLLDETRADSADSHAFTADLFGGNRHLDYRVAGILALDLPAAWRMVFERLEEVVKTKQGSTSGVLRPGDAERILQLAIDAVSDRTPSIWLTTSGYFNPPRREGDFPF